MFLLRRARPRIDGPRQKSDGAAARGRGDGERQGAGDGDRRHASRAAPEVRAGRQTSGPPRSTRLSRAGRAAGPTRDTARGRRRERTSRRRLHRVRRPGPRVTRAIASRTGGLRQARKRRRRPRRESPERARVPTRSQSPTRSPVKDPGPEQTAMRSQSDERESRPGRGIVRSRTGVSPDALPVAGQRLLEEDSAGKQADAGLGARRVERENVHGRDPFIRFMLGSHMATIPKPTGDAPSPSLARGARHADAPPVLRDEEPRAGRHPLLPDGRLLRDVLRGREGGRADPRDRADGAQHATPTSRRRCAAFPGRAPGTTSRSSIAAGRKVAICDQVEDPRAAKGLVRRDITRVITPGTVLDPESLLPAVASSLAVVPGHGRRTAKRSPASPCWTSRPGSSTPGLSRPTGWRDLIALFRPREILLAERLRRSLLPRAPRRPAAGGLVSARERECRLPPEPGWRVAARRRPRRRARTRWRCGPAARARRRAGAAAFRRADGPRSFGDRDAGDLRILRRVVGGQPLRADRPDADASRGARLKDALARPSTDPMELEARWDAVEELSRRAIERQELQRALDDVGDLERRFARIATATAGPREVASLGGGAARGPTGVLRWRALASSAAAGDPGRHPRMEDLAQRVERTLAPEPPVLASAAGVIRDGADAELDSLRGLRRDAQGRSSRSRPRNASARASAVCASATTASSAIRSRSGRRTARASRPTGSAGNRWRTPSASSRRR